MDLGSGPDSGKYLYVCLILSACSTPIDCKIPTQVFNLKHISSPVDFSEVTQMFKVRHILKNLVELELK